MPSAENLSIKPLHDSVKDGAYHSFMIGIGETYLAAFVLFLGFGQIFSGMVTVIPMLIASVAQLLSSFFMHRFFDSKKKWVVFCIILQASSLIALAAAAFTQIHSGVLVFFLTTIYWAAGLSAGPTWNAWIGTIIPNRIRIRFFAYRSQICYSFLLLGLIAGGLTLHFGSQALLRCFSTMFIIAGISRLVSAYFVSRHPDIEPLKRPKTKQILSNMFTKLKDRSVINLLLYLFIIQIGVYISAPYLNPFMLEQLKLDYSTYMILISSAFICRIFAYKFFGALAKKKGPAVLLGISAIGIIPLPGLWTLSDHLAWMIFVQFMAGIFWAAHELGLFYVLLNKYSGDTRSDILTFVNVLNSIGMLIGSLIGGYILKSGGLTIESYYAVLILSSVGRAIPLFLLPQLMDIKIPARKISKQFFLKIVGIRPNLGIIRPIFYDSKNKAIKKYKAEPENSKDAPQNEPKILG